MDRFEGLLCVPLLPSKLSIWGVQDWSKASRFDHGLPGSIPGGGTFSDEKRYLGGLKKNRKDFEAVPRQPRLFWHSGILGFG